MLAGDDPGGHVPTMLTGPNAGRLCSLEPAAVALVGAQADRGDRTTLSQHYGRPPPQLSFFEAIDAEQRGEPP